VAKGFSLKCRITFTKNSQVYGDNTVWKDSLPDIDHAKSILLKLGGILIFLLRMARGLRMRVLHVIPAVAAVRGGPSHAIFAMVKALRSHGIDAEIATTNNAGSVVLDVPFNRRIEYEGVPVWFFPQFPTPKQSKFSVGKDKAFIFSPDLTKWLWQHLGNYDLIEAHYLFSYASSCAGAIARIRKIPYIVRTIGQLAPWALAQSQLKKRLYAFLLERHNLTRAAAIHCTSVGEVEDVHRFGIETPTFTLPLGVDQPEALPEAKQALRDRFGIPHERPIVLFLSRIHPKKRPDLLLHAISEVIVQNHDCHLIFAGGGDTGYLNYLTNLVSSLGLVSRTSFAGFVVGEDKALLLQGSDLFVLPSFAENFGVAVAEAMAAGLPVIVTPDVQISPDVAAEQAGLVVKGNVDEMTEAITCLLSSPDERSRLGKHGQQLVQRCYSWDAIAQNLAEVYAKIVTAPECQELNRTSIFAEEAKL
jgi:glycosyltransferase involved in cell wall biosynthesis